MGNLSIAELSNSYWASLTFSEQGAGGRQGQQTGSLDLETMTSPAVGSQHTEFAGGLHLAPVLS